jgi:phage-related protein (TIGR01555 family)
MSRKNRRRGSKQAVRTFDGYTNPQARLGTNTDNLQSGGTYIANYTSRNRNLLEMAYRSSFLVGAAVDATADDMTRKGISIVSRMKPGERGQIDNLWDEAAIWDELNNGLKWSRLYGGAIIVVMIDGQDMSTPLNIATIGKGQFKGLLSLDRWSLTPSYNDPVTDYGPDFGKPKFYKVGASSQGIPAWNIHYSRIIRLEGDQLPHRQSQIENGWGMSVVERIFERIEAFDTATAGVTQLIHKAHLRTYGIEGYRNALARGGDLEAGVNKHLDEIRRLQTIEGMTVMDLKDRFETHSYTFAGISDVLCRFAEQVSGATGIPLVRLFGQSPGGFSTGETDLENYYSRINTQQERRLRRSVRWLLDISHRSLFGTGLPDDFTFTFNKLWEISDTDRSTLASNVATAVATLVDRDILPRHAAMNDIRNLSEMTGIGGSITDEDIDNEKTKWQEDESETRPPPAIGTQLPEKPFVDSKPDRGDRRWNLRWLTGKR